MLLGERARIAVASCRCWFDNPFVLKLAHRWGSLLRHCIQTLESVFDQEIAGHVVRDLARSEVEQSSLAENSLHVRVWHAHQLGHGMTSLVGKYYDVGQKHWKRVRRLIIL